ncbi:MAG: MBL fold metallo-hydrolase [Desulfonauticus sp.]|nr:MBL fold metallo-hydrolase [Desulfonauticus sp.]
MKIKFLGAARTVTGSCFILSYNGRRFAIDCGMHQGNREIEKRNWNIEEYDPKHLDFIIITHAHIDHSGLLPKVVKEGFKGKIYLTPPTADLLDIMLADSAHVQEMEVEWKKKKKVRRGDNSTTLIEPLYTQEDVDNTLSFFEKVDYGQKVCPFPGLEFSLYDAGHILGSASVKLTLQQEDRAYDFVFSGDLGRPHQLIVNDPTYFEQADFVFMESTYGDRDHKDEGQTREELLDAIWYAYKNGEKVIIPAFAVERTQEILFILHLLYREDKLPKDMPIFLDSPLAIRATEVFKKHYRYFDELGKSLLQKGDSPLDLPTLKYSLSTQDSMRLNNFNQPAIIISASGMAHAGRIKHHLKHNLWRDGASIVFVGFQAKGTTGRKIVDGAKSVKIFGEQVAVRARVYTINGFSSHAGQSQLLTWLGHFKNKNLKVFLVHGEEEKQNILATLIKKRYSFSVHIPEYLEECEIALDRVQGRVPEEKRISLVNWDYLFAELKEKITSLEQHKEFLAKLDLIDQTDVRDEILDVISLLNKIHSDLPVNQ